MRKSHKQLSICMIASVVVFILISSISIFDALASDSDMQIENGYFPCTRTVVSVAVLPPRWDGFEKIVLPSLIELRGVDAIYVHVQGRVNAYREGSSIPKVRLFMHEDGVDLGPASKLLRTLPVESDPQSCIVTVDDDTIYSDRNMAERLRSQIERVPTGAVGNSCEEASALMAFIHSTVSSSLLWWDVKNSDHAWKFPFAPPVVRCHGWLQGCEGVVYRRGDFPSDDLLTSAPAPPCFFTDDVLLSGHLHARGIPRYVLLGSSHPLHLPKNGSNALSMAGNVMHERQWPCVQRFFFPPARGDLAAADP